MDTLLIPWVISGTIEYNQLKKQIEQLEAETAPKARPRICGPLDEEGLQTGAESDVRRVNSQPIQ